MGRRRTWIALAISVGLAVLLVTVLFHIVQASVLKQQKVWVLAPSHFLPVGHVITASDVTRIIVFRDGVTDEVARSKRALVGRMVAVAIGKHEPFLRWKVTRNAAMPRGEERTFQIPKSYLFSVANELRAGDAVYVYVSSRDGSKQLFPDPVRVHAVKTAANQEVTDLDGTPFSGAFQSNEQARMASRRNANGAIESVNLNLRAEQWLQIDQMCKEGAAHIALAYSSSKVRGG